MATYSYSVAKTVLTENEKDRLVCLSLNRRPDGSINWEKATAEFGSASVNSMKTSHGNTLRKIEKAGGKVEGDGSGSVVATPKKASGKKRAASPGGDDEDTPPAPKKGRKKKAVKEAAVDSAEEDATTKDEVAAVKTEVED